jgi:tetratricopeptide (TPR) repeat protein
MKNKSAPLILLGLLACGRLPEPIYAANPLILSCLDHNSPERTISRCTEVINRGDQVTAARRADAYRHRGDAYLFNGKVDLAIADLTEAIRLKPSADAYTSRGAAYYQKGDVARAKADWAQAERLKGANRPQ